MGTYISHFRNTDLLLKEIQNLEEEPFLFGSLAPDSGIRNEDWTEFNIFTIPSFRRLGNHALESGSKRRVEATAFFCT
jgi:hypothetical protein